MRRTENQDQHLSLIEKKMSSKGIIIHLDNDLEGILNPSKNLFSQTGLDLEYIVCDSKEAFAEAISIHKLNIKSLIFDLLSSEPNSGELHQHDAEFLESINTSFLNYNIPIFVYSGYLQALEGKFENHGTIFKIDKGTEIAFIFDKIKKLFESGFIDVFSPNGLLNEQLLKDLNLSFTKQFSNNTQIEAIIDSIIETKGVDSIKRIQKVFQRIALRSLMSNLLAPEIDEGTGKMNFQFLNTVEHYVQRISSFDFWTGDIFLNKKDKTTCFLIVTPRCNVASKSFENLLVCEIELGKFPSDISNRAGKDKIGYALTDNPEYSGYDRYLPKCPFFQGGKVVLSKYHMINRDQLLHDFDRVISLSEDLTNEILGKFGAYFFRSGINPWDKDEAISNVAKS